MIERLLSELERLPIGARRALMTLFPVLLLGVVAAGIVFASTVGSPQERSSTGQLLPPAGNRVASAITFSTQRGVPSSSATTGTAPSPATVAPRKQAGHDLQTGKRGPWPGSLERLPSSRPGSTGQMLRVARQFSLAYMPYQIGRLPRWVRVAIKRTCTPAFAGYLLAQPPRPTVQLTTHLESIGFYRVAGLFLISLGRVQVNSISRQDSADKAAFVLTLVARGDSWLVSGLEM